MQLTLTRDMVAKTHHAVTDSGPRPGFRYLDEADYAEIADRLLASSDQAGFWVFAYGSLIWKPEFPAVEELVATVNGWHRAFALRVSRWRGTPECPGLMLALDRGGRCRGVVCRMPDSDLRVGLLSLLKREMTAKPSSISPRWVKASTVKGALRALAFTVDRRGPAYAGRLAEAEVVESLSTAVGHWGSCAEYLLNTVEHLEQRGIHDRMLWRLQARVAERIDGTQSKGLTAAAAGNQIERQEG